VAKLTAVVSKDAKSPNCEHAQFYVDGDHVGYMKVEIAHLKTLLAPLEDAGFTIVNT